ncbi:MAG TPA: PIN domain-containing protein [Candidatus Korarchaeota archaeon]|nr:PIN domain-containing protein [Candidatus Korarchaeota archaeon]
MEWIPIDSNICLVATLLMSEYGLSPFDAYHSATAIARDKKILSTEHVYDRLKGVERIDPIRFSKGLEFL